MTSYNFRTKWSLFHNDPQWKYALLTRWQCLVWEISWRSLLGNSASCNAQSIACWRVRCWLAHSWNIFDEIDACDGFVGCLIFRSNSSMWASSLNAVAWHHWCLPWIRATLYYDIKSAVRVVSAQVPLAYIYWWRKYVINWHQE